MYHGFRLAELSANQTPWHKYNIMTAVIDLWPPFVCNNDLRQLIVCPRQMTHSPLILATYGWIVFFIANVVATRQTDIICNINLNCLVSDAQCHHCISMIHLYSIHNIPSTTMNCQMIYDCVCSTKRTFSARFCMMSHILVGLYSVRYYGWQ